KQQRKADAFKVHIEGLSDADDTKPSYPSTKSYSSVGSDVPKKQFSVNIPEEKPKSRPQRSTGAPARSGSSAKNGRKAPAKNTAHKHAAGKSTQAKKSRNTNKKTVEKKTTSRQLLTPEQQKRQKEQRKYNLTKGLLITCACLVFIVTLTAALSSLALSTVNDILAINNTESSSVSIVIPQEATDFESVYEILCNNGLVKRKLICKLFCKFRHYDEYYSSSQGKNVPVEYEPGVYYLDTGSGIEVMLETIKADRNVSKDTVTLTFPEGWTIAQIFEKIEKYGVCTAEKLYANLDIVGQQYDFYTEIPATTGRYLKAEGYLYPDTYEFFVGENASSVLKKLFKNFQKKWDSECEKKAKQLGLTTDEVIIIASIIQREANDKTQMADISSVIHNRLADKATYPLLEMNSTKDYITSLKKYELFNDSYYSIYLDSYNTYSAQGLPPGAICNPGQDAINAALNPNDTDYHFFCHDDNGNIYLAVTAAEHKANTEKLLLYGNGGDNEQ
ncbi:MAG: endolytic transglycosylase MltG, partial [Acutalibacteraceae bacterium]